MLAWTFKNMIKLLTYAWVTVSNVSLVTGTVRATRSVGTGSISVTVISTSSTLINI
jgi:hypothetical protein